MQAVLVVDDDVVLCQIMARTLAEEGYHVFTAGSGEDAAGSASWSRTFGCPRWMAWSWPPTWPD